MVKRYLAKIGAIQRQLLLTVTGSASRGDGRGFVLVGAMLMLFLLVLIGISSTTSTTLELQIAGAERIRRETFYHSDAGGEIGVQLLEENLACLVDVGAGFTSVVIGNVQINNPPVNRTLADTVAADPGQTPNVSPPLTAAPPSPPYAAYFAPEPGTRTNLVISRTSAAAIAPEGTAMRQVTGYEHKGAGVAGGSGFYHRYNVYSQHQGIQNSESVVHVRWRHIVGLELDTCRY